MSIIGVGVVAQALCAAIFLRVLWTVLSSTFIRSGLENVPGPRPRSWWKGNFREIFNPTGWEFHRRLADEYGSVISVHAPMGKKWLYTFDPKAMHTILVKDQSAFEETDEVLLSRQLIFGKGLLSTEGVHHRKQRKMLSPVFSAAHMRDMIPTFYEIIHKMEGSLRNKLKDGEPVQEIDMLSWMARVALELVGQSGLGYSFDPMTDEATAHPYSQIIKDLVPTLSRLSLIRNTFPTWLAKIGTPAFRRWVVDLVPWKDLHKMRDMIDYMHEISLEIYNGKKKAFERGDEVVERQIGRGKDILSVLMRENMKASDEDRLDEDEIIDQMSTLTFAAMDTTSSALARTLHLLATHSDVQEKLRQEIDNALHENGENDLAYDALVALPYLDAICRETLRLYAPAPQTLRCARQDAVVPLYTPFIGHDGTPIQELHIKCGTRVIISIMNSNRNSALWGPDALEWKPERWLEPLPKEVMDAPIPGVYSHLMTFNGGGRSCIGFKFSQLEMKAVLAVLIKTFKFTPSLKDSEVYWHFNGVVAPVVGKHSRHPELPLNIALVN